MKTWLNILLFGVLLAAGLWFYLHRPATRQATTEGLQIDDTENIVTEIRSMARLITACYYSEITLVKRKANPNVETFAKCGVVVNRNFCCKKVSAFG